MGEDGPGVLVMQSVNLRRVDTLLPYSFTGIFTNYQHLSKMKGMIAEMTSMNISEWSFEFVEELEPRRNDDGTVEARMPQQRYKDANSTPVHQYGWGPFCKFSISGDWDEKSGVYILMTDNKFLYVGETKNLERQLNRGFGHISPRHCFKGGQQTNCRINSLIRESAIEGTSINLFFHETDNRRATKQELINELEPAWNKANT